MSIALRSSFLSRMGGDNRFKVFNPDGNCHMVGASYGFLTFEFNQYSNKFRVLFRETVGGPVMAQSADLAKSSLPATVTLSPVDPYTVSGSVYLDTIRA